MSAEITAAGSTQALEYAQFAVDAALRSGATQAEATVSVNDRFSTEARDRAVTKLEQSTGRSLHLRVFVDGRKATLATSDFNRDHLGEAITTAVLQARHVASDPYAALPERASGVTGDDRDLDLFSQDVAHREAQAKIDEALELESRIRALDPRITNSNGAHVGDTVSTTALANSNGFAGAYRSTRVHRSVSPVALDGQAKRTGSYGTAARRLFDMEDALTVAKKAVERTVMLFGGRKPQTMRVPVIFERDVAGSVLSDVFSALSASNVAIGNSWLAERVGSRIGSDLVSIVDDGTMPGLLGSSPFDGEGVPTQRTVIFERGTLRTFLYDTYYARKLGARSTGNGSGGGVAPNNLYLEPGQQSLEAIIASTPRGILVMDTIGFATEHASGTYSRGARGLYIQDGEIAYPVEEFTIAGTFPEMLAGIDAVANDLRFDAGVVSPSFRVAEMTVSGD
ncbi:MAG TPA: TldD/PmbA family protein [Candidatus Baltobacteraceae bacterium]|nr:TldD/PmbA family protein [Candidatus Baltobacteraceae bacterium]